MKRAFDTPGQQPIETGPIPETPLCPARTLDASPNTFPVRPRPYAVVKVDVVDTEKGMKELSLHQLVQLHQLVHDKIALGQISERETKLWMGPTRMPTRECPQASP